MFSYWTRREGAVGLFEMASRLPATKRKESERRLITSAPFPNRREAIAALGGLVADLALPAAAAPPAPRLRRGVSLHHMLNWPRVTGSGGDLRYAWPPFATPEYRTRPDELRRLRSIGFDFVRLTADPSVFIALPAELRAGLHERARNSVAELLAAGFNVVFDLHPVAVNLAYRPEALVSALSSEAFAAYVEMATRVAAMLKPFSPDRVALELFNEPWIDDLRQAPRWQAMLETLHERVRAADADRPLVLNGLQWDSVKGLAALDARPFAGSNVIYTFHYYEPRAFTHQGATADTRYISGLGWPAGAEEAQVALRRARSLINASSLAEDARREALKQARDNLAPLASGVTGEARIAADFATAARWARNADVSAERVFLGEFGCVSSPDPAHAEGRSRWLSAVRRAAENEGFGWAYWAYSGNGGMQLVSRDGRDLDLAAIAALGLHIPMAP
jgi:endoglucanase